jgi:hypothetical protein
MARGISLYAGELEGRLDALLRDAYRGELLPLYDFMKDLPALEISPSRTCPRRRSAACRAPARASMPGAAARFSAASARSSTCRGGSRGTGAPDDVERIIRANLAQGVHKFFVTDDNFSRNRRGRSSSIG